ncbi:MAG: fumarylacetoacetate hydrolase family protein, partial [Pseudomonadota bacterium]
TVYCIGRNYADHAREMGHDPTREPPFFFQKSRSCVTTSGVVPYPRNSADVHFEVELVAALGMGGKELSEADALACVFGFAVGLDMTRRDRQVDAKNAGLPWDISKSFPNAAPCSAIVPLDAFCRAVDPGSAGLWDGTLDQAISLTVNGEQKQSAMLDQMIWRLPEQIAILSRSFDLQPGDLIFTGTPAGVGPVRVGDRLVGLIDGVGQLDVEIVDALTS